MNHFLIIQIPVRVKLLFFYFYIRHRLPKFNAALNPQPKQFKFKENHEDNGVEIWAQGERKPLRSPNKPFTSLLGDDDNI